MDRTQIAAARYIGARVPRKEDPRLLTGRGQFVDDVALPGMLHVAFARSPIARGRIVSIDLAAALELPGVHAIYTAADLDRRKVEMLSLFMAPSPDVAIKPLADGRVAYVGDPFALVIADSRALAEDAAALIAVEFAEEDPVVSMADAAHAGPIHPGLESNVAAAMGSPEPAPELAELLDKAPFSLSHRVLTSGSPILRWKPAEWSPAQTAQRS